MKKIIIIGIAIIFMSVLFLPNVYATSASLSFKASNENPTVGDSVTVTVTAVAGGFNLTLTGNGQTEQIVGQTDRKDNVSKSASITFTPSEAKEYVFELKGDYSDYFADDAEISVNKTITIKAKEKTTEEKPENETETTSNTTVEETKKEVIFTESSGTVYTTVDSLNFRSISDGSVIGSISKKGTELKKTGIADGKVRVIYNGKEGYVSSNYVTTTKPENLSTDPEVTFKEVKETVYASNQVNIRKGYSTSDTIVGSLKKGESITRVGIGSNGWSKVEYNGEVAYISTTYLTTTKPVETEKSSNANLKTLVIKDKTLTPEFSANTTSYTLQVEEDVQDLEIKAEAEDAKATVTIDGNKNLKEGKNTVAVSVSAEDGTLKIYEIEVQKSTTEKLGLKSLKIDGTNIYASFKADIYSYDIEIDDVEKLEIEALANDKEATVEILGNENLEDENTITIIVTSKDGAEKVTYQVNANKKEKTVVKPTESKKLDSKIFVFIGAGAFVLLALIIVVIYTIKHRNQDDDDFYFEEDDDFEYEDEPSKQNIEESNNVKETNAIEEDSINDEEVNADDISYEEPPRRKKGKHF